MDFTKLLIIKDRIYYLALLGLVAAVVITACISIAKKTKKIVLACLLAALIVVSVAVSIPTDYDLLAFGDHHDRVEFLELETKSFVGEDGTYTLRFVAYNRETKRLEFCVVLPSEDERTLFALENFQLLRSGEPTTCSLFASPDRVWGKYYQHFWLEDVQPGDVVTLTLFGVSQSWTIP